MTTRLIDTEAIVREVLQKQAEKHARLTHEAKQAFERTQATLARARAARAQAPKR